MTPMTLERIEHGTLSQRAAEAMLNYILANDLKPGAMLPSVATLAEKLGASRPIVRESLNALRALGIIEIANGKKATIRDLDNGVLRIYFGRALQIVDDSMRDVMDVRIGIEIRSAALAARHRSAADIARLQAIMAQMQEGRRSAAAFSRHDTALHLAISQASGNKLIFHIVESLQSALRNASYYGVLSLGDREALDGIIAEHARLVEAIVRGDEDGAAALMHDHLAAAMQRMQVRMG
jgi:GntR family transcriptional repressor for pyruvate dehydrogenase complex